MKLALLTGVIGVLVFCGLLLALYAIVRSWTLRRRVRATEAETQGVFSLDRYKEGLKQIFKPLGEMVPRSPEDMSRQERRLVGAGFRRKDAVVLFLGSQVAMAILFALVFAFTGQLYRHVLLFLVVSVFLGAALPDIWLRRCITTRKYKIQLALPDALDLAVVCVEAGLGLDQALARISQEIEVSHPELADELRVRNMEINLGHTRTEAFRNLANRTGVQDLRSLVAILIQTDRFGTSVGQSLRVFADSMRVKRRQRAEERAAKIAIKMLGPLVLFVFPAVLVVVVGPAVIGVIRDLLPVLTNGPK